MSSHIFISTRNKTRRASVTLGRPATPTPAVRVPNKEENE